MIEVKSLSYRYDDAETPAVDGVDFAVQRGEIFGFLGPNGAGKSTTQKILIGLLDGYAGRVRVLERDRRSWNDRFFEYVGVGFEFPNHYKKLSGRENLALFASLYDLESPPDLDELLELVDLSDAADTRVEAYSKGMQVRLGFARAILNQPELLFLDEPTAGLDPVSTRRIQDLIRQQQDAGRTVFLTTHNMAVADALCDRVAFIVDGKIELIDSPRQLELDHGRKFVRVEYREAAKSDSPSQAAAKKPSKSASKANAGMGSNPSGGRTKVAGISLGRLGRQCRIPTTAARGRYRDLA